MQKIKHEKIDPIQNQDVQVLVKRVFEENYKLASYSFGNYSEEKLGFLGAHRQLVVITNDKRVEGEKKTKCHSFFVKSIPYEVAEQAVVIEDCKAFFKETNFYKNISPELLKSVVDKFWLAKCHLVKDDALIFEDLRVRHFNLRGQFLNYDCFKSGLLALANLHASSILTEKRLGKTFKELYPEFLKESLFDKSCKFYDWYRTSVDVVLNVSKYLGLDGKNIVETCDCIFDKVKTSEKWRNVICHGDLKSFNMMFASNINDDSSPLDCVLVDFQLLRYCPAMVDLSQMLYLSTRRSFRDEYLSDLLKHYHKSLCMILRKNNRDIELPKLEQILQEFADMKLVGVVTASLYFPIQQLEGKRCAELTKDSNGFTKLLFKDRVDLVLDTMRRDERYNEILTEIITELVEITQLNIF